MSELSWSGWTLAGHVLVAPRRAILQREEAAALRHLMELRIAHPGRGKRKYADPAELVRITGASSLNAVRQIVAGLRSAMGRDAIRTERDVGYLLMPANRHSGNMSSPIDDLVFNLEQVLSEARRIRQTIRKGLYDE